MGSSDCRRRRARPCSAGGLRRGTRGYRLVHVVRDGAVAHKLGNAVAFRCVSAELARRNELGRFCVIRLFVCCVSFVFLQLVQFLFRVRFTSASPWFAIVKQAYRGKALCARFLPRKGRGSMDSTGGFFLLHGRGLSGYIGVRWTLTPLVSV